MSGKMHARLNAGYRFLGVLAVFASFALAACPQPTPDDGALACSAAGECPKGYRCHAASCFREETDLSAAASDLSSHDHSTAMDLANVDQSGRTEQCEMFCTCMLSNCPANLRPEFDSALACATYCINLPVNADMTCRIVHCGLALSESNTALHCPHARGIGNCADL